MKVVKETKTASVKQMEAMASNLNKKLNHHVCISMGVDAYISGNIKSEYQIYIGYSAGEINTFDSWEEMTDFYNKLISS